MPMKELVLVAQAFDFASNMRQQSSTGVGFHLAEVTLGGAHLSVIRVILYPDKCGTPRIGQQPR